MKKLIPLLITFVLFFSNVIASENAERGNAVNVLHEALGKPDMTLPYGSVHAVFKLLYYKQTNSIYVITPMNNLICSLDLSEEPVDCTLCNINLGQPLCS